MKILILKKERVITTTLPNTIYGDFQIVDIDDNGNQVDLITIKESNGKWLLYIVYQLMIKQHFFKF